MQFIRDADFADRIKEISVGYMAFAEFLPPDKQYEATLHLCLCQSLLTYCKENTMSSLNRRHREVLSAGEARWGVSTDMIKNNSFVGYENTIGSIVVSLRNAVSHPTPLFLEDKYCSTGFKTLSDERGKITSVAFVHSPDVYNDRPRNLRSEGEACRVLNERGFPHEAAIHNRMICVPNKQGDYEPYVRYFRMDIPIADMVMFVQKLSAEVSISATQQRR